MDHFASLEDTGCPPKRRHILDEMIVIAIAAMRCGADGWVAIAEIGRSSQTKIAALIIAQARRHRTRGQLDGRSNSAA